MGDKPLKTKIADDVFVTETQRIREVYAGRIKQEYIRNVRAEIDKHLNTLRQLYAELAELENWEYKMNKSTQELEEGIDRIFKKGFVTTRKTSFREALSSEILKLLKAMGYIKRIPNNGDLEGAIITKYEEIDIE